MLRKLAAEPLVHFLLLGAALFALNAALPDAAPPKEIVVTEGRIHSLAETFRRTFQREPTRQELDALVEDFVREEVLYREALAAGLDRDDSTIRRRLRQKMEFLAEEAAAAAQPTDKELADYLAANPEAFRTEPRVTFSQEFLGGRLSMLEPRYENVAQREVERLFGREFAEALAKQPPGSWAGPIASGYGAHRVRVEKIVPGGMPRLEDVRPLVEREWRNARRKALGDELYARLRGQYKVVVGKP
ncbi:MAG TPA: peptidylprolyl isomerase [Burkholderiales bacterium]|nr:peptidylprolyl isomerase [Burkholderiales bacterium]